MQSSPTATIHSGPAASILSTATSGLLFLKSFLEAVNSLDTDQTKPLDRLVADNTVLILGNKPPFHADRVRPMLEGRSKHLGKFELELTRAWDIELPAPSQSPQSPLSGKGKGKVAEGKSAEEQKTSEERNRKRKRTVMFEATSTTIFKNDPDRFAIKIKEFTVLELEGSIDDEERLVVAEIRTYLDSTPVQDRAARLNSQSTYGESKSQY